MGDVGENGEEVREREGREGRGGKRRNGSGRDQVRKKIDAPGKLQHTTSNFFGICNKTCKEMGGAKAVPRP